jgi:hypothetical protein
VNGSEEQRNTCGTGRGQEDWVQENEGSREGWANRQMDLEEEIEGSESMWRTRAGWTQGRNLGE